jgi:hypothetical protein
MSKQLVNPRLDTKDEVGYCLRFVQAVYGAKARYKSAWDAWEATKLKHGGEMPDVSVPVWFSHYGTYGEHGHQSYGNWGHVVAYVPGRGFLSSPGSGYGQKWLSSIKEIERFYNAKYVGWSEDINGLRVAEYTNNPTPTQKDDELMKIVKDTTGTYYLVTPTKVIGISTPEQLELYQRLIKSNPENPETLAPGQIQFFEQVFNCECE